MLCGRRAREGDRVQSACAELLAEGVGIDLCGEGTVNGHVIDRCAALSQALGEQGLPNLWIPRKNAFVFVDDIPLLGTGKVDLRALKRIAQESLGGEPVA